MKDGWKPKLRGSTYCSPLCGGGCTKAAHDKAVAEANALVLRMKGSGWKPRVWENLGWHYEVHAGPVALHNNTHNGKTMYGVLPTLRLDAAKGPKPQRNGKKR